MLRDALLRNAPQHEVRGPIGKAKGPRKPLLLFAVSKPAMLRESGTSSSWSAPAGSARSSRTMKYSYGKGCGA
jgi:hypothetical protein